MTDDNKTKRSTDDKQYKTEWSFSFDKIGDSLNRVFGSLSGDEETQMASFSEAIGSATSAEVNVHFSVGENTVGALVGSDNLFEADVTYLGELVFDASGETNKVINLKQKTQGNPANMIRNFFGTVAQRDDLRWDLRLSPDVPLALKLDGGVGRSHIDLSGLKLKSFDFESGVGESTITLPTSDTAYTVDIEGGVGRSTINLPVDTTAHLNVEMGVGAIEMHLPANIAVRLEGKSGIGDIKVPTTMTRVSGKNEMISKSGVWETADFENATHKITIKFEGGIGTLSLKSDVTVV